MLSWFSSLALSFSLLSPAHALTPPTVSPAIVSGRYNREDAVLVIVNESYQNLPQVLYAQNDGRAFLDFARNTLGIKTNWRTIRLENVTSAQIQSSLKRIRWRTRRGGTVWVYYVGHGYVDSDGERLLVGVDAKSATVEDEAIRITDLILDIKNRGKAEDLVFIADADFGGVGRDGLPVYVDRVPPRPNPSVTSDPDIHIWLDESTKQRPCSHKPSTYSAISCSVPFEDGPTASSPAIKMASLHLQAQACGPYRTCARGSTQSNNDG